MAIDESAYSNTPRFRLISFFIAGGPSALLIWDTLADFTDIARYQCERDLVRRWTGRWKLCFMGEDLTYFPRDFPPATRAFAESSISIYEKIHPGLVRCVE